MRIDDGHSTTIEFSAESSADALMLWEKTVTPPGLEGGGANETTTMRNVLYRTKSPKKLITLVDSSVKVAYDPEVITNLLTIINTNNQITITYPDGSTVVFWGWLDSFIPDPLVEGEQPEATVVIIPSNQNDSLVETAPVFTPAS